MHVKVIGEIGINHNGSVSLAKRLMEEAYLAGCDFVKFQKRSPEDCVPEAQKAVPRYTPWGTMPYIEYKHRVELGHEDYAKIYDHARRLGIGVFASVWDLDSVDFMAEFTDIGKIPSALITNEQLLVKAREEFDTLIVSTGMSTEDEIEAAIEASRPDVIMHSVSSYPSSADELNLRYVSHLAKKFDAEVGYSGHELQIHTAASAVSLGAEWIERHITLSKRAWGSDQACSLEPDELRDLVRVIRETELVLGPEEAASEDFRRQLVDSERAKKISLRGE